MEQRGTPSAGSAGGLGVLGTHGRTQPLCVAGTPVAECWPGLPESCLDLAVLHGPRPQHERVTVVMIPPHCPGAQSLISSPLCLPTCSAVPQTMAHVLITSSSICRLPSWSWSHLDFAWLWEVESQGFIVPLPTEVVPVASGSQRLAGCPPQVLL